MYAIRVVGSEMYLLKDESLTPNPLDAFLYDDIADAVNVSFQLYSTEVVSVEDDGTVEVVR